MISGSFCWAFGDGVASGVGVGTGAAVGGFVCRRPDWATTKALSNKSNETAVVRLKNFMWTGWERAVGL